MHANPKSPFYTSFTRTFVILWELLSRKQSCFQESSSKNISTVRWKIFISNSILISQQVLAKKKATVRKISLFLTLVDVVELTPWVPLLMLKQYMTCRVAKLYTAGQVFYHELTENKQRKTFNFKSNMMTVIVVPKKLSQSCAVAEGPWLKKYQLKGLKSLNISL